MTVPIALLRVFSAMLPKLDAEERLAGIRVAQLGGSATVEIAELKSQIRSIEAMAGLISPRSRPARPSPESLAAMGIGVVMAEQEPSGV